MHESSTLKLCVRFEYILVLSELVNKAKTKSRACRKFTYIPQYETQIIFVFKLPKQVPRWLIGHRHVKYLREGYIRDIALNEN